MIVNYPDRNTRVRKAVVDVMIIMIIINILIIIDDLNDETRYLKKRVRNRCENWLRMFDTILFLLSKLNYLLKNSRIYFYIYELSRLKCRIYRYTRANL